MFVAPINKYAARPVPGESKSANITGGGGLRWSGSSTHTHRIRIKRGRIPIYTWGVLPRTVKKPGSVDGLLTVITVRAHQTEISKEGGSRITN